MLVPASAALAINYVDYFNFYALVRQRQAKAAMTSQRASSNGGGGKGGKSNSNAAKQSPRD